MSNTAPDNGNPPKRPWLLMLYMSADAANLQAPLVTELDELLRPIRQKGGAKQKSVYVMAQIETPGGVLKWLDLSTGEPIWLDADATDNPFDFIKFARERGPGKREAIVFWGHSAGVGTALGASSLPTPELGAIGEPRRRAGSAPIGFSPIDILAFDSCYLGSLEIARELEHCGTWMLACENSISLTGWQFDVMVTSILAQPEIEPKALAQRLVNAVSITRLSPSTLSLYKLHKVGKVARAVKDLVDSLSHALDDSVETRPRVTPFEVRLWILNAFHHALSTKVRQFLDLPDLCRRLAAEGPGPEVRRAARSLLSRLNEFIFDSVDSTGTGLGGVSVYCPWPRATEGEVRRGARNVEMEPGGYAMFPRWRETGWVDFVRRHELVRDADQRAIRRQTREYSLQGRPWPDGRVPSAWEAKPFEMGMKPIEMEMKPIEMEMKPIEMELKPIEMEIFPRF